MNGNLSLEVLKFEDNKPLYSDSDVRPQKWLSYPKTLPLILSVLCLRSGAEIRSRLLIVFSISAIYLYHTPKHYQIVASYEKL